MGAPAHDWAKLQIEYVTDPQMSLRKLSKKYSVPMAAVTHHSKNEKWFEAKQKHQHDVISKAMTKAAAKQSTQLAKESDYLALMKGHLERMLRDEKQFNRHLVQESSYSTEEGAVTTTEERIFDKVDARALKDTMQTLKMVEDMTRSLYNLQKAEVLQRQQIEAARLALERERFEWEKEKAALGAPDKTNSITIEGIEKEWSE